MSQSSRWKSQGGMNRRPTNNIVTNNNSHSNILNARTFGTEYTTIDKVADLRDVETASIYRFDDDKINFANVISYYPFNDLSYNTPLPSETTNNDISNQSLAGNLSTPKPFPLEFQDPSISGTFYKPKVAYNDLISQNVIQLDPSSQVLATDLSFNTKNAYDTSGSTISAALTMSCFVYIPDSDVSTTAGQSKQFCLFAMDDLNQTALQNFSSNGGIPDGSDNLLYLWYPNKNGKAQLLYGYKSQNAAQSWSYINTESTQYIPADKWTQVVLVLAGLSIYVIVDGTVVISSSGSQIQGASYVPDQPFNINLGPYYYDSVNAVPANLTTTNTATPLLSDCKIANWAVDQQLAAAVASPGGYGHQYSVTSKPNKEGLLYYLLSKDLISFSTPTLFRSDLNLGGNLQSYGTNNFYGQSNFYTKTYFADGFITDGSSTIVYDSDVGNLNIYSSTPITTGRNASLFITNSSETGTPTPHDFMASMLVFNDNIDIYSHVNKGDLPTYVDKLQFSISGENVSVGHGFGDSSFNVFGDSTLSGLLDANGGINTPLINSISINVFDKLDVSGVDISNNLTVDGKVDISNNLTVDGKIDMSKGVALNGQYGTTTLPIGASSPSNINNTQQLIHFITDPTENPSNDWAMFSSETKEASGSDRGIFVLTVGDNSDSQNDKFIIRGNNINGNSTWSNKDLAYFSSQNGVVLTNTTIYGQLDVSGTGINFTNGYIGISQDTTTGPIRIGNAAGETTQGNYSVAIGNNAGKTTQGQSSVAIGNDAANSGQGQFSVAIGIAVGYSGQGQFSNAIGYQAGKSNQGESSVAIGSAAGNQNQGDSSVAMGNRAGQTDQSNNSVAIGNQAGETTQGPFSVAIGQNAGNNTQGQYSVAIGQNAGRISQLSNGVAIGYGAGYTGQKMGSVAIGQNAGYTTQGGNSVAMGNGACEQGQGSGSVAIGESACNAGQGSESVAIGYNTVCTHNYSVALGKQATTTASNQIVLGTATETVKIPGQLDVVGDISSANITIYNTGSDAAQQPTLILHPASSSAIGYLACTSNRLTLQTDSGGSSPNNTLNLNNGNVGIGTLTPITTLEVVGDISASSINTSSFGGNPTFSGTVTAASFNATSDIRLKENITNLDNSLDKICNIRGVNYNWKNDETKTKTAGVIAQEVLEQIPEAVNDNDSEKLSVNYNSIIAHLIESVKELKREIDELKAK